MAKKPPPTQSKTGSYTDRLHQHDGGPDDASYRLHDDFFRKLVQSIDDYAIFTTNLQGQISSWNIGAHRLLGYSEEDIIGQPIDCLFTEEDRLGGKGLREQQEALEHGSTESVGWRVRKDGSQMWAQGQLFPLIDTDGQHRGFTKIIRDFTTQRELETVRASTDAFVERNRLQLANILTVAGIGTWSLDLARNSVMADAYLATLFGIDPEAAASETLPLQDFVNAIHPDDRDRVAREISDVVRTQGTYDTDYRVLDAHGDVHWVNARGSVQLGMDGQPRRFHGVLVNITQRKAIEESLRLATERLAMAQQAGNIGLFTLDVSSGQLLADDIMGQLFGIPEGEREDTLPIDRFTERIHEEDWPQVQAILSRTVEEGGDYQTQHRVRGIDEAYRWIDVRGQLQIAPLDGRKTLTGVLMDITDRKRLERHKDDFISIAIHELKTPVTSMKTYAQVLNRRLQKSGDTENGAVIEKISAQIDKLNTLIADLLDVTRLESQAMRLHLAPLDIDRFTREVIGAMQHTTTLHRVSVHGQTLKVVQTDADRLEQVLTNLISNAIKYSPHSDIIDVILSHDHDSVTISVQDHGIGIDPSKQTSVFERFYRVSGPNMESFPGLGLGLYISAQIVGSLGGRIWVESDGQSGSTFSLRLPLGDPLTTHEHITDHNEDRIDITHS